MVDEKELEEKEYYRKRLGQWKDLGFDTQELEIMLETDFERLKEMKFNKLRDQLKMMTSEESIPKVKVPPHLKSPGSRIEVPIISELKDRKRQKQEERLDHLHDIRMEMDRRRKGVELSPHDLAGEFDDGPKRKVPEPQKDTLGEYPLISFHAPEPDPTKKSLLKGQAPRSKINDELAILEEEASIIKRKKQLLEEEEARLHRKKMMLASVDHEDRDEDADLDEKEEAMDEPALIFVGGDRGLEPEDLDEDDEEMGATISVDHGRRRRSPRHEDEEYEDQYEDEEEETENDYAFEDDEEDHPAHPKKKLRKGPSRVVRRPPRKKARKTRARKIKKGPAKRSVKKVRKRPHRKVTKKKVFPYAFLVVIIVIISVVAGFFVSTPSLTPKINVDKTNATIGEVITFDASGSTSAGDIQSYKWSFGDGSKVVRGIKVTKIYQETGNYTVTLTVKDDGGTQKKDTVKMNIKDLAVTLPPKMLGDKADYNVKGLIKYTDESGIIKVPVGGVEVKVVEVKIDYTGTLESETKSIQENVEDGFGELHTVVYHQINENLEFNGVATTDIGAQPTVHGTEDIIQHVYVDMNTDQTIKTVSSATTNTDEIKYIGGIKLADPMTSLDKIRSYPDLATIGNQINVDKIFSQKSLDTGDPSSLSGTIEKGVPPDVVIYTWNYAGVDEVYNRPAIKINVTIDKNTQAKLALDEFWVDLWYSHDIPTYVKIHTYLEGKNGTAKFKSDSTVTMNDFTRGAAQITGNCSAQHYLPSHPLAISKTFNITPPEGDPTNTSHLFPARLAMEEALNQSSDFRGYMSTGSPYVVSGNYSEKSGPTWNLTFGKKGSETAHNIIVKSTGTGYTVVTKEVDMDAPTLSRDDIPSLVTFSSAERIFKADSEVATELFATDSVNYQTTTLYLDAQTPFPSLDFTLTSISSSDIPFTYSLSKVVGDGDKSFSTSLNAVNGQMLFVQEHSGDIPMFLWLLIPGMGP